MRQKWWEFSLEYVVVSRYALLATFFDLWPWWVRKSKNVSTFAKEIHTFALDRSLDCVLTYC
jgi:hypothetical protein